MRNLHMTTAFRTRINAAPPFDDQRRFALVLDLTDSTMAKSSASMKRAARLRDFLPVQSNAALGIDCIERDVWPAELPR
jgi:hypothetical protein